MFAALNNFLTGSGRSTTLQTYTFPAGTSSWTAPPGVTSLVVASGYGAAGTPGGWSPPGNVALLTYYVVNQDSGVSNSNASSPTWGDILADLESVLATINSSTGQRTLSTNLKAWYSTGTVGGFWGGPNIYSGGSFTIDGTCYITGNGGGYSLSEKIANSVSGGGQMGQWRIYAPSYYDYPTTGASTTGFSLTFPGGTGGAPGTTTFNNVAVTPGNTYTISNNGALTIQYYA